CDLRGEPERRASLEPAMGRAAQAQSALRVAIAALGAAPDADQTKLFLWLRATGLERRVWIPRFMRQDDPADPAGSANLRERVRQLNEQTRRVQERGKRPEKFKGKGAPPPKRPRGPRGGGGGGGEGGGSRERGAG